MKTIINKNQRDFILRAINNMECLFDFEEDNKEFKKSYGITKKMIVKEVCNLREVLKWIITQ